MVSQVNGGVKTFSVFDGETLLGEIDQTGTVTAAYTWGAAGLVSERLVASSRSLWYAFWPQGETRGLTDASDNVTDTYVYSAYGQPVSSSGTDTNPFRYGGQVGYYTDEALTGGAVLCTHRWYDPNAQRWLSRDSIGYAGGDNLYGYCSNNPVSWYDADGAAPRPCQDIANDIWKLVQEVSARWHDMRNDSSPGNKFPLYPFRPNVNPGAPGKGTWPSHAAQIKMKQARLRKLLNEWNNSPCSGPGGSVKIPVTARRWMTIPVPTEPVPPQRFGVDPRPQDITAPILLPIFMGGASLKERILLEVFLKDCWEV